jgi:hypothetical protein
VNGVRVPLYDRLPEIYRIRDAEQLPPDQLRAYLAAVEEALGAVHESVETLYHDLFIDTCQDWVVPYIGDLLGTTHLKGDARTLRADVADTIALRRRKGTREAIERLAANLTGWPCRAVELFQSLAWAQHLNHQRPDAGGAPPYADPALTRFAVRRGGTVPVRDPAMLSLLGTPFDPFAYTADVKRADDGAVHVNLPNLAIWLWRLVPYRLAVTRPLAKGITDLGPPPADSGRARFALRFDLDPLDRPVRLFNTWRRPAPDPGHGGHPLTAADAVPGPIPDARLTTGSEAGNPSAYVRVDAFDASTTPPGGLDLSDVGIQLYFPDEPEIADAAWTFRGDNLCAWEEGLRRPLAAHEIVIDPDIGRMVVGVAVAAERDVLVDTVPGGFDPLIYVGYTYGAPGPVGAHPVSRAPTPTTVAGQPAELRTVSALAGLTLQDALADLHEAAGPVVVEIDDSLVHPLDPSALGGVVTELGVASLRLAHPLVIRASAGQRPVVRLETPLAFRPVDPGDPSVLGLTVRLEGLYLTRDPALADTEPLVARAAVARLELDGCTLDPGGHRLRDGTRAPLAPALRLEEGFGFAAAGDLDAFEPTHDLLVRRSVTGALLVDDRYRLVLEASVVDAGGAPGEPAGAEVAVGPATDPGAGWGAPLEVHGAHLLGRTRVAEAVGAGALFAQRLEVWNHQRGCLKHCWFSGDGDRLPPHHACVAGPGARLRFTSLWHGDPGYAQLARSADWRVRARGPGDDQMGAYGFLLEAHRAANLAVRLREFMPVGVRPLIIAVT